MRRALSVLALALALPAVAEAQRFQADSAFLAQFRWRSIGPANMGGRVVDLEANPRNPKVIFVAFATSGLWKSVNAGTTWTPVFDRTGVHAVSEVTYAPSDTTILYAGTGEPNSRNSISPGNGVYKSTDAGATWTHLGLAETHHIGRILVHPTDPNTVWVSALGKAWGTNPERGVYKTTDGGRTWRKVLATANDSTGVVDMALDPTNPMVLYASSWQRIRGPYFLQSGGRGSGLWKSTDGGETWTRITGNGLPTTTWGRSGVAVAPSNPSTVYVIVEADTNPNPESVRASRQRGYVADTARAQRLPSGLFRSTDAGQTWTRMNNENNRPFYYSHLLVDPRNENRIYWLATQMRFSNDGGVNYRTIGQGIHGDFHAIWINPNDPDHYIVGEDGGVAQTFDRGRTYDAILQMAVGQFYEVGLDMQRPFWVCGGLQDNGTWCGPTESVNGRITNQDWVNVGGGDGFYALIDPTDPDVVYSESQGGNIQRRDLRTWQSRGIRPGRPPQPAGGGPGFGGGTTWARLLEDSLLLARGDTTQPMTPAQQRIVDSLRARIAQDTAVLSQHRFNWSSPFLISAHNPATLYMGGQRVWKTVNRGDFWTPVSDDLSTRDSAKVRMGLARSGGITMDVTNAEIHGTVTALAESRFRPGLLLAGTDDGNVQLTRNDGATWENLTGRFPGVPRNTWVTRVELSSHDSLTMYVTFDGHRTDDFRPYVFVSNDFGRTFRSISGNLPATEYVHAFGEHPRRRDLLFVGTERTAYVSTNGGESWQPFNANLPPAPVHALRVHPRDRILVAATHGRSIWTVDIGVLEQATDSLLNADVAVFQPEPALMFSTRTAGGGVGARGHKAFSAANSPTGVRIPVRIRGADGQFLARGPGADTTNPMAAIFGPQVAEMAEQFGFGGGGGGGGGGGAAGIMQLLMGGPARPPSDSVTVTVTDISGNVVRTLYTNARATPLRWITWDMRRDRAPLGPAALRDSVRNAARMVVLRDSIRTSLGMGAAGQPGAQPAAAPGGPGGGVGALMRDPERGEPGQWTNPIQRALNPPSPGGINRNTGGGGGGFGGLGALLGGGGGAGSFVEPGVYLVTVRMNGRDYRQAVRIERPAQSSAIAGGWQ